MFQQLLANKHHRLRDFKAPNTIWPSGGLCLVTDKKKKNKSRVKQEPRSAHGRAVNKHWEHYIAEVLPGSKLWSTGNETLNRFNRSLTGAAGLSESFSSRRIERPRGAVLSSWYRVEFAMEEYKVHVGSLSYNTDDESLKFFFQDTLELEVKEGKWSELPIIYSEGSEVQFAKRQTFERSNERTR